jgi:hypothetical protein
MAAPGCRFTGSDAAAPESARMLRTILAFGTLAGLLIGIPMFGITVAQDGHLDLGMAATYLLMLVALSTVFVAIKRRRDRELGGVIRFWPALLLGVGISVVAGVFYVVSWEAAMAVTKADFASDYAGAVIEQKRASGASEEALAKVTAQMEAFKQQYADPLYRLPMVFAEIFPVGLLVSAISAGLLRNSRFLPAQR